MASGSVAIVASEPMTTAVRMLLSAWYSTSLPVRSVPNGWSGHSVAIQPISMAVTSRVTSIGRHGRSVWPRTMSRAEVANPPRVRPRSAAIAAQTSRPTASPAAAPDSDLRTRSGTHSRSGSCRCAPPWTRRGKSRTSTPFTTWVSRWNDHQASGTEYVFSRESIARESSVSRIDTVRVAYAVGASAAAPAEAGSRSEDGSNRAARSR